MKTLRHWMPLLVAGWLCGCLQVKDELTLQPDGSGTVRLEVRSTVPEEMTDMLGMSGRSGGGGNMYPPVSEAEAREFFPAKSFTLKVNEADASEGKSLTIEAAFKDVNALLASPYARAHQLSFKVENGVLSLKALGGGEAVARLAGAKPEGDLAEMGVPGLEELQKKKSELRFEFRVTLPNAVTDANGAKDGKTVTWTAERAKCKDDTEFAAQTAGVLEARCPADSLKTTPNSPPRLGLLPFAQLGAGAVASTVPPPDTNKIAAAARFVPYALHVTRGMDLSGEGGGESSGAELTGAIVIPTELAPSQWGEPKLEEAVDAKGKSLMPKTDDDPMSSMWRLRSRYGMRGAEADEEDTAEGDPKKSDEQRHAVTLAFKAPDWKVKKVARIRALVPMQYVGDSEVVKLSNAVPASLVMDPAKQDHASSFESERGLITDARLTALGVSLRVQMAMVQSGLTMLSLEAGGAKAALLDVQVFDAEGRPWPTSLARMEGFGSGERSCQVMVAGQPKAPFSLGVLVGGMGTTVNVPVVVEQVPVGGK